MKILLFFLLSVLCCCGNIDHGHLVNIRENTKTIGFQENGDFRVDEYESKKLLAQYFYQKELLKKVSYYDSKTGTEEGRIVYSYDGDRKLKKVGVIKGEEFGDTVHWGKYNLRLRKEFLETKNIEFPSGLDFISDEVRDLAKMFYEIDENDFKGKIENDGTKKVLKFSDLNKKLSFVDRRRAIRLYSYTSDFFGEDVFVNEYELTLKDNYPVKEVYITRKGSLTREYLYKHRKIIAVTNKFLGKDKKVSFERRFEYHKLDKPFG